MEKDFPSDVLLLLQEHPSLSLTERGKIKCSITSHEMPMNKDAILQYVNGSKYKKAKDWYSCDITKYEPYIVQHRSDSRKCYCKLTGYVLNRIEEQLQRHVAGKKFLRLKRIAEEKMEQGIDALAEQPEDGVEIDAEEGSDKIDDDEESETDLPSRLPFMNEDVDNEVDELDDITKKAVQEMLRKKPTKQLLESRQSGKKRKHE